MSIHTSKYFGPISLTEAEEYYNAELSIDGRKIEVDMNFEENTVTAAMIDKVDKEIANLKSHIADAMNQIKADFDAGQNSEVAREFFEHHLEDFDAEEKQSTFGAQENITRELFLASLEAHRAGFYPEEDAEFMVIDISFRDWDEITNYLMPVSYDSSLNFTELGFDS